MNQFKFGINFEDQLTGKINLVLESILQHDWLRIIVEKFHRQTCQNLSKKCEKFCQILKSEIDNEIISNYIYKPHLILQNLLHEMKVFFSS